MNISPQQTLPEQSYYTPEVGIWLSVDPLSDKYPSMSAFMYCAGNPVVLVDPDGREIFTSAEGWAIMERAFNATLGAKNNPFSYDKETGKVTFDEKKARGTKYGEVQQEIVDRYESLVKDEDFRVDVKVVSNDENLDLGSGKIGSLEDKGWMGAAVLSEDGKQASAYISNAPQYYDSASGKYMKNPQRENMQGIVSIHEIGGHIYGYQQGITDVIPNNKQTTEFEKNVDRYTYLYILETILKNSLLYHIK